MYFQPSLIRGNGFPLELHSITSSDGYVTNLYRIPWGRNKTSASSASKNVFLLHHGFIEDGFCWVLNSVDKALGM
jgi:lysosomal acid lipase/cholesteryl ester hydrolase